MTEDMELLRTALAILVNENLPIRHRLDKLRPANGGPLVKGLGRAVITAILQVAHPEKYGVLNQTVEDGMKSLGLWPSLSDSATFGENYEFINAVLLKVAQEIPTDLWTLDLLWWRVRPTGAPGDVPRSPVPDPAPKSLLAFFSYTRLDDEYSDGAITSLRRSLELGVRVFTGDRTFTLFQDVEGIEFGQKWKKRVGEAISTSSFLIPVVTPLFFTSDSCRFELKQFIEHEKSRGRDDLILPIYFETAPLLEDPELRKHDALASEIAQRQRYDWRDQGDLKADDPRMRHAVRELAEKIASAVARASEPCSPTGGSHYSGTRSRPRAARNARA